MADDLGERTEEATRARLRPADGKVASSRDLGSAIALLLGTLVIWFASGLLFSEGQTLVAESMSIDSFDHACTLKRCGSLWGDSRRARPTSSFRCWS